MPTSYLWNFGSINVVRPTNTAGNSQYQCTELGAPIPATERLQELTYPGVNGVAIKKLGAGAQAGSLKGFIDADTSVNLASAKTALDALCKGQTAGTIGFFSGALTVSNGIVATVTYGNYWGYGGRVCLDFEITWKATG
jgi:hypothetical protein